MSTVGPRVLVLEDEKSHQLIIDKSLSSHYQLDFVSSAEDALELLEAHRYEAFIIDVVLPQSSGFEVLAQIRKISHYEFTPALILSAREQLHSKLTGFSLGADDYVVKPVNGQELKARIDSKLRTAQKILRLSVSEVLEAGDLHLDMRGHKVFFKEGGKIRDIYLSPIEFKILSFLFREMKKNVTRKQIIHEVWGDNERIQERSVDGHIAAIRKKLKGRGHWIRSVHRVGYRLEVKKVKKAS